MARMTKDDVDAGMELLVSRATERVPFVDVNEPGLTPHPTREAGKIHYSNQNDRLGIDFTVEVPPFPGKQTLDPRIVRVAPGKNNEHHKHAHETVFVIVSGVGEVVLGERRVPVTAGDVCFVPRWVFHQSVNLSSDEDLVIVAITDFGFTSTLLGDYDKRTRLARGGDDVLER